MIVCTDGRQDDLRAAKVANLIGISAGIYSNMDDSAYGINGVWAESPASFFPNNTDILTGTPVVTTNYSKEEGLENIEMVIAQLIDKDVTTNSLTTNKLCLQKDVDAGVGNEGCVESIQDIVDVMTAQNMFASKTLKVNTLSANNANVTANITANNLTANKQISATTINASNSIAATNKISTGNSVLHANGLISANNITATNELKAATVNASNSITATNKISTGSSVLHSNGLITAGTVSSGFVWSAHTLHTGG